MTAIDCNGMTVLDRAECFRRLGRGGVGRVALAVDGRPAIFPVNFAVDGEAIVFLTSLGSKLSAAAVGAEMALEVDETDSLEHSGWSVVAVGPTHIVPPEEELPRWRLRLARWIRGGPEAQVRIEAQRVSGREINKFVRTRG